MNPSSSKSEAAAALRHLMQSPWDAKDLAQDAPDGDRVARLHNYFFNPDFIAEVCGELGVPWRSNGYRWFLPQG
jgi:hypothetical protein